MQRYLKYLIKQNLQKEPRDPPRNKTTTYKSGKAGLGENTPSWMKSSWTRRGKFTHMYKKSKQSRNPHGNQ